LATAGRDVGNHDVGNVKVRAGKDVRGGLRDLRRHLCGTGGQLHPPSVFAPVRVCSFALRTAAQMQI